MLAEAGAIPTLLEVILSCCTQGLEDNELAFSKESLVSKAMGTLMNTTDGNSAAKKIAEQSGMFGAMKAVLGDPIFSQSQENEFLAIHHTLGAIMNLSHDEDLRIKMISEAALLVLIVPFMSSSFTPVRYYATSIAVSLTISGRPRLGEAGQEWELSVCSESEAVLESMGAIDRIFYNAKVMDPLEQFELALSLHNYARLLRQLPLDCACTIWTLWTLCHILASGSAELERVLKDVGVKPLEEIIMREMVAEGQSFNTSRAMQAQRLALSALGQLKSHTNANTKLRILRIPAWEECKGRQVGE